MSVGKVFGILVAGVAGVFVLAALVAAVLVIGGGGFTTRSPLTPGEATREIAALRAKLSSPLQAVSVVIDAEKMTIELQSPKMPQATDEWTVSHTVALGGLIDWMSVSGPEAVQADAGGVSVKDRAFDLAQIDFAVVPKLAQAAIDRVRLQEGAAVTSMELSKPHVLIPVERAGALRWLIHVASAHETAEAYADPAGRLTGIDVSHTLRAQTLDLFQGGQPLLDIVQAIDTGFDGKERIDKLLVYSNAINFRLVSAGSGDNPGRYVSDINGLRRDPLADMASVSIPTAPGVPTEQPISIRDVDWAAMPRLVGAARQALGMPDARITSLAIRKIAHGLAAPVIEWEFDLQSASGSSASITLDGSGKPFRAPRGTNADLLEPAALARLLEMLRAQAGEHAAVMELRITSTQAVIGLRDPRQPAVLVLLTSDGSALDAVPGQQERPGRWNGMPYDDDWLFDLAAIDGQVLQDLPIRESAAVAQLKIPGGKVSGVTFGRQRLMFANNRQLVVEVEVAGDNNVGGRVFFDPRGKVLRSDGP